MAFWDNVVNVGGMLLGGVGSFMNYNSAQNANENYISAANAQNEIAMQMFHEQMDFQERMYKNRHTYEVEDLRNAGLNPILSANSASSSPMGASPVQLKNPYEQSAQNKLSSARLLSDLNVARSTIGNINAQKDVAKSQAAINKNAEKSSAIDVEIKEKTKDAEIASRKSIATVNAVNSARSLLENLYTQSRIGKFTTGIKRMIRDLTGR